MALYDYMGALRLGRKQYQAAVSKGEYPYLPVLDQILANVEIVSEVNLGLLDVPLERIVGTKTQGRTQAFAGNFMPLLNEKSEFGAKWSNLYDYQIDQGIADPIIAYEFMNRFYVMEGNKRVSVLKYLHAYSIPAYVTRLLPKRSDDRDIRLYYAFLDFYQVSFNCDVWFSQEGSYAKLLEIMGKKPGEQWSEEDRADFKGTYDVFKKVFEARRTEDIELTVSDAFLVYVEIFGYETVKKQIESEMKAGLEKIWAELVLQSSGGKITLVEDPEAVASENSGKGLFNWLMPAATIEPEMLKVAFIHAKNKETSSWTYGHELGRIFLEQCYGGKLKTMVFENNNTEEEIQNALSMAIESGCNLIFTTSPQMAAMSVKMAVQYPQVRIFNCSVNMSYSSISTYYARAHESKFIIGALAAALCDTDKLGYIADYPVYGRVAGINAFAAGARMINPRVEVHLKWAGLKKTNYKEELETEGITYISGDDLITPGSPTLEYGLYHKRPGGEIDNLAMSFCNWGKFYEIILEQVCRNAGHRDPKEKRAINYWWGMSADIIDVICSANLPSGSRRLIRLLGDSIRSGAFRPFSGAFPTQDGKLIGEEESQELSPEDIISMDWLLENVIGTIPDISEFEEELQPMIRMQSAKIKEKVMEVQTSENSGTVR
ncbi:MAG: BMP family ABC transporter substrate-binding protein [Brotaphodocola sp.]